MKIQGVNITGGIRLDPPTPSDLSKFVVGARREDVNGIDSGAVYVYNTDGTGEVKITASDGATSDNFGSSVAMSDTKVVVSHSQNKPIGVVYVYNTDGTGELKIQDPTGNTYEGFGESVAVTETKIAVGAYRNNNEQGAVYVYNTDGTGEQKITASDGADNDRFGESVAMSDTKVIVGAPYDDDVRGAVYVYNTDGTGELRITASDRAQNDRFGYSVAVTDTKVVVGAPYNDDPTNSGSVYVYNTDGTGEVKITASDGATSDNFGSSVAMSDTHIVVGVSLADIVGSSSGCVYVYNTDGTGEVKITPSDAADNERFGHAVAIQGDKIIVGTPQTGNGAVYVYNTDGSGEQKISAPAGVVGTNGISFGGSVATK